MGHLPQPSQAPAGPPLPGRSFPQQRSCSSRTPASQPLCPQPRDLPAGPRPSASRTTVPPPPPRYPRHTRATRTCSWKCGLLPALPSGPASLGLPWAPSCSRQAGPALRGSTASTGGSSPDVRLLDGSWGPRRGRFSLEETWWEAGLISSRLTHHLQKRTPAPQETTYNSSRGGSPPGIRLQIELSAINTQTSSPHLLALLPPLGTFPVKCIPLFRVCHATDSFGLDHPAAPFCPRQMKVRHRPLFPGGETGAFHLAPGLPAKAPAGRARAPDTILKGNRLLWALAPVRRNALARRHLDRSSGRRQSVSSFTSTCNSQKSRPPVPRYLLAAVSGKVDKKPKGLCLLAQRALCWDNRGGPIWRRKGLLGPGCAALLLKGPARRRRVKTSSAVGASQGEARKTDFSGRSLFGGRAPTGHLSGAYDPSDTSPGPRGAWPGPDPRPSPYT